MPHLNEADRVLLLAQRFHDAVDAIAWQPEHHVHTPGLKGFDENIGSSLSHFLQWLHAVRRRGVEYGELAGSTGLLLSSLANGATNEYGEITHS